MAKQVQWLSDEEWARIEPLLPRGRKGAHRVDDRRVVSGIVHMLTSRRPHSPPTVIMPGRPTTTPAAVPVKIYSRNWRATLVKSTSRLAGFISVSSAPRPEARSKRVPG